MEEALLTALSRLDLPSIPSLAVQSLFDTRGTAVRVDYESMEPIFHCDFVQRISLRSLRDVDRALAPYFNQDNATESPLMELLVSDRAMNVMYDAYEGQNPPDAAYRLLLTLLHCVMDLREVFHRLKTKEEQYEALSRALVASKIYFSWIQEHDVSTYGVFMPCLYRIALDVLRKWVHITNKSAVEAAISGNSTTAKHGKRAMRQNVNSRRRRAHDDFHSNSEDDQERQDKSQTRVVRLGEEVVVALASFVTRASLAGSKESLLPTIESALCLHVMSLTVPTDMFSRFTSETLSAEATNMLLQLMNGHHGDVVAMARIIVHAYIRGVTFQEQNSINNRCAAGFHKLSLYILDQVHCEMIAQTKDMYDDVSVAHFSSLLRLGIIQNICMSAPGRADERQKVLPYLFTIAMGGGNGYVETAFNAEERARLLKFLPSYCHHKTVKNRQFGIELVGKLVLESSFWTMDTDVSDELKGYTGLKPLLELLVERSRDKASSVRSKAIAGISALLTAGLSLEDEYHAPLSVGLRELLNDESDGEETLMPHLLELFRRGLVDDKTFVRKAAIQAVEALVIVRQERGQLPPSMRRDVLEIQSCCSHSSIRVRVQALKSISALLLAFPQDAELQGLWLIGVLPLCADPENSVQSSALDWVHQVLFYRLLKWSRLDSANEHVGDLDTVWDLAQRVDGGVTRSAQNALSMLMKSGRLDAKKIVKSSVRGVKKSVADGEQKYWGFSWAMLEELSRSDALLKVCRKEKGVVSTILDAWRQLAAQKLPQSFFDQARHVLRVIAAVSSEFHREDASRTAGELEKSLNSFAVPLHVIGDALHALHSIWSVSKGKDQSARWGQKLLAKAEKEIDEYLASDAERVEQQAGDMQRIVTTVGELVLLDFKPDDESGKDPAEMALLEVPLPLVSKVQLLLPPTMAVGGEDDETVDIPKEVRICAFVSVGKVCLRDEVLAKDVRKLLVRELRSSKCVEVRSNALMVLSDLCVRYTSLVDGFIPTIALSLLDSSPLVRRSSLLVLAQLVLQDYVKWRDSLVRFFFRAAVDESDEVAGLARHIIVSRLVHKAPNVFTSRFLDMLLVLNGNEKALLSGTKQEKRQLEALSLPGARHQSRRFMLYKFFLENLSDEQKLEVCVRLCNDVLEAASDGKCRLALSPADIQETGFEAVLEDTFAVLCSPDIKLNAGADEDGEDDEEEEARTQLRKAKGKLLSKMSKKNYLENVVPVLMTLKRTLERVRSPVLRHLRHYIKELFKLYKHEVTQILSSDPQLAIEFEYDLRQAERKHRVRQEEVEAEEDDPIEEQVERVAIEDEELEEKDPIEERVERVAMEDEELEEEEELFVSRKKKKTSHGKKRRKRAREEVST